MGYDGIQRQVGLSLARLMREVKGPYYVHCHHGRHRGPAAAAVAAIIAGDMDPKGGLEFLARAGTDRSYVGLWRDVERFQVPSHDVALPKLVEVAELDSLTESMANIDRLFDGLVKASGVGWQENSGATTTASHRALLLHEALRECDRQTSYEFDEDFHLLLKESIELASQLESTLRARAAAHVTDQQLQDLRESCHQCHEKIQECTVWALIPRVHRVAIQNEAEGACA